MNCLRDHEDTKADASRRSRLQTRSLRKSERAFADPRTLEARLWTEFTARCDDADITQARVLLMGFDHDDCASTRQMVRAAGVRSCAVCRNIGQLDDAAGLPGCFTHVVINIDAFNTSHEAVDALMEFRMQQKETVVVLVSAAVSGDDFGSDRKMLCDATLRAPLSLNRIRDGLAAAWVNHRQTT